MVPCWCNIGRLYPGRCGLDYILLLYLWIFPEGTPQYYTHLQITGNHFSSPPFIHVRHRLRRCIIVLIKTRISNFHSSNDFERSISYPKHLFLSYAPTNHALHVTHGGWSWGGVTPFHLIHNPTTFYGIRGLAMALYYSHLTKKWVN